MVYLGVAAAALAAFMFSFAFYALVPAGPERVPAPRPQVWQLGVEVVRNLLTATLVAGLMAAASWHGPATGALLGLALSVLPLVLLTGSVLWEATPIRTAAVHALDWVLKLVLVGTIVGALTSPATV